MMNIDRIANQELEVDEIYVDPYDLHEPLPLGSSQGNKYQRAVKPGVLVDVYDVLVAFNVTCPALAHGVKKMLAPGQRGVKSSIQDKQEAIAALQRSIEIEQTALGK